MVSSLLVGVLPLCEVCEYALWRGGSWCSPWYQRSEAKSSVKHSAYTWWRSRYVPLGFRHICCTCASFQAGRFEQTGNQPTEYRTIVFLEVCDLGRADQCTHTHSQNTSTRTYQQKCRGTENYELGSASISSQRIKRNTHFATENCLVFA